MNAQETIALVAALKAAGATHFKSQDFEISISPELRAFVGSDYSRETTAEAKPVEENKEATEKLKDLISTLSLPDDLLMDKIFPAGAGG